MVSGVSSVLSIVFFTFFVKQFWIGFFLAFGITHGYGSKSGRDVGRGNIFPNT